MRVFRSRIARRALAGLVLVGLTWGLYAWLPPDPRWTLPGPIQVGEVLPDGVTLATWPEAPPDMGSVALRSGWLVTTRARALYETQDWIGGWRASAGPLDLRDLRTGEVRQSAFADLTDLTGWACSPDRRYAAAGTRDGKVHVADLQTGATWTVTVDGGPGSLTFAPDGATLAVHGNALTLLDTRTGRKRFTRESAGAAGGEFFTADGRSFYFRVPDPDQEGNVHLCLWDLHANREIATLRDTTNLRFLPDGRTLLAVRKAADGERTEAVVIVDVPTGKVRGDLAPVPAGTLTADVSPDGGTLALWGDDPVALQFWDLIGRRLIGRVALPKEGSWRGQFSPDGRHYATSDSRESRALVYDPATARPRWEARLQDAPSAHPYLHLTQLIYSVNGNQLSGRINLNGTGASTFALWTDLSASVAPDRATLPRFTADGQAILGYAPDGDLQWRDAATGKVRAALPRVTLPTAGVRAVQLTADRRWLAVHEAADPPPFGKVEEFVRRWLPDGWFARRSTDEIAVIDVAAAREVARVPAGGVGGIYLAADGQTLLTHHPDEPARALRCWDVPAPRPWCWIAGPPLGLTAMMLGVTWWRGRKATAKA